MGSNTRKPLLLLLGLALTLAVLTACTAPSQTPAASAVPAAEQQTETATAENTETTGVYQVITAEKAKQIMDNEQGITIVDVRELSEYKVGHIKGAKLLPLGEIAKLAATELPDKNATILVYCRSGSRSKMGANTLLSLGYTKVLDFGGIMNWPYEIVTD